MRRHQFAGEINNRVHVAELDLLPPGVSCGGAHSGGGSGALRLQCGQNLSLRRGGFGLKA